MVCMSRQEVIVVVKAPNFIMSLNFVPPSCNHYCPTVTVTNIVSTIVLLVQQIQYY